jgi:hypothetical protein
VNSGVWNAHLGLKSVAAALVLATGCYVSEAPEGEGDTDSGVADTDGGNEGGGSGAGEETGADTSDDPSGADETGTSGGSDGDTDGDDTGSDGQEGELEDLIGALCEWEFNCCSEGEIDYRLGPFTADAGSCRERYVEQLYSNDDVAESNRGGMLYVLGFAIRLDRSTVNRVAADECRQLIEQQQCAEVFDGEQYCSPADDPRESPCDLRNLFQGTLQVGEACSANLAGLGFDIECAAGASCEDVDGDYVCVDKGLEDEFCEADYTCDEGLYCEISSGLCRPKAGLGEPCAYEDPDDPALGTESTQCRDGLTCDAQDGVCRAYCTTGYACAADSVCAEGESCIPVDFEDGTHNFCAARGDTNGDRCDTDRDCADGFHCSGDTCASDRSQGTECSLDEQCEDGLFCDTAGSGECEIVLIANAVCGGDNECNPNTTIGCITSDNGQRCRTALLDDGDDCVPGEHAGGNWCASGVCEDITDDGVYNPECHEGADVGDACDDSAATFDELECRRGTYCLEDECVLKQDAGGDCSDDGNDQCLNGTCDSIWEGDYCTDGVPVEDLETAATCDGVE